MSAAEVGQRLRDEASVSEKASVCVGRGEGGAEEAAPDRALGRLLPVLSPA